MIMFALLLLDLYLSIVIQLNKNITKDRFMEEIQTNEQTIPQNIQQKEYSWGLDIIRIIAMFLVVLVHSTTFYGFYDTGIISFSTFLAGFGRYIAFACVPLFLLLTGYLNTSKTPSFNYYIKLAKILIEFALCTLIINIVNNLFFQADGSEVITLSLPLYRWYINMYIGLFLLIPFLNYAYKAIPDNFKWGFIITLVLIFSNPQVSTYWTVGYPIMYYFIGMFIKDKQFKVNKIVLLLVILFTCLFQILLFCHPIHPLLYEVENHYNFGCLVISVAIFLLFYNIKSSNEKTIKNVKFLRIIANASIATFLISEIFESFTKQLFNKLTISTFNEKLPYLAYLTPLKFILSVICGIIINFIATKLYYLFNVIVNKIIQKRKKKQLDKNNETC